VFNTIQKNNIFNFSTGPNAPNDGVLSSEMTLADPAVVYNVLQCAAYAAMAIMIMRLKLFFVPQLCILVSLIGNEKVKVCATTIRTMALST